MAPQTSSNVSATSAARSPRATIGFWTNVARAWAGDAPWLAVTETTWAVGSDTQALRDVTRPRTIARSPGRSVRSGGLKRYARSTPSPERATDASVEAPLW